MARRSPPGLVVRVVRVPGGAGVGDARRRVLDLLLAAARTGWGDGADATPTPGAAEAPANVPPPNTDPSKHAA